MQFNIKIRNLMVSVELVKTKRKGVLLEILPNSILLIRAPKRYTKSNILNIINNNEEWIYKISCQVREKNHIFINRKYESGELYLFLGEHYKLNIFKDSKDLFSLDMDKKEMNLFLGVNKFDIKEILIDEYKKNALEFLKCRVAFYEKYFDCKPKTVLVKNQKTRWGSCTCDNKLLFNWKIIMAKKDVIDYLVVHEMCHMKEKNHSKNFWNLVESILPNYKSSRIWLKENGMTLEI